MLCLVQHRPSCTLRAEALRPFGPSASARRVTKHLTIVWPRRDQYFVSVRHLPSMPLPSPIYTVSKQTSIPRVFPHLIVLNVHVFTGRSQFIITLKLVLRVAQEVTKCKFDDSATSTQRRFEDLFSSFLLHLTPLGKGRRDILETRLHELHLGFFVCLYRSILRRV